MVNSESQPSAYEALESLPQCPVCHREDSIEKASSVVRRNSGQAFIGDGVVSYRFTSTIAVELASPPPPAAPTWGDTAFRIFFSLAIAGLLGLAYYLATEIGDVTLPGIADIALIAAGVWFGFLMPAKMAVETAFRRRNAQGSVPAWREATARWDNLYYCVRDDVGFVKGGKDWRTPDRVGELLYPRPQASGSMPSRAHRADATVS